MLSPCELLDNHCSSAESPGFANVVAWTLASLDHTMPSGKVLTENRPLVIQRVRKCTFVHFPAQDGNKPVRQASMSIQQQHATPLLETGDEPPEPPPEMVEPEPPAKPGFTLKSELWTMFMLGWPMVISFVCRIAMASTDTAFVGHLNNQTVGAFFDRAYTGEEYLAAASLSDMVVNVLIVPPLAFNQSLNALVSQAMGSGNKPMAGPAAGGAVWLKRGRLHGYE